MSEGLKDALPEAKEYEITRYGAECPGCGEWHEEECHLGTVDCICGVKFKAKP